MIGWLMFAAVLLCPGRVEQTPNGWVLSPWWLGIAERGLKALPSYVKSFQGGKVQNEVVVGTATKVDDETKS